MQVDHVVLFDFPLNVIDYLHRIGRTARAAGHGKVTAFIKKGDRVLADNIKVSGFVKCIHCLIINTFCRLASHTARSITRGSYLQASS